MVKNFPADLVVDNSSKKDFFSKYEYFIGFDSILLLEAYLSGSKCISIKFLDTYKTNSEMIPISFALEAESLHDISRALSKKGLFPKRSSNIFAGSSLKCFDFIKKFLEDEEND